MNNIEIEESHSVPWNKDIRNKGKLIINNRGEIRKIQYISDNEVATKEQNLYDDVIFTDGWKLEEGSK
tara:strand:+ start:26 stop:229 length:204 start_codon:yes stop_codon:yes gene_type:complete